MKLILLTFFTSIFAFQATVIQEEKVVPTNFSSFELDEEGNLYAINNQKHLLKLNSDLDTLFTFNSKVIEVDLVAPQNMLKILVFSKSLNSIQFLDKTLSEASSTINLDDLGIELSKAVGVSRDNNFWIFDAVNQELKKFDKNLNMISSSGNLMNLTNHNWDITSLKECGNKVFLCDSNKGILEFDFFGSYLRTIKIKPKGEFQIKGDNILFIRNDSMIVKDLILQDEKKQALGVKNIVDFAYYKQKMFLLTKEKFYIYHLSF